MTDSQRYNYHDRIIDEAADWFIRLQDSELSSEDREAFADWLSASSEHVREYLALTTLHTDISELPSGRSVGDLIANACQTQAENVIPLRVESSIQIPHPSASLTPSPLGGEGFQPPLQAMERKGPIAWEGEDFSGGVIATRAGEESTEDNNPAPGTGRVTRFVALAASVAVITLACVWWLYPNANGATYTTSIGEQKSFPLPDGSVVTLNAVSKLQIRYTERYRDVQLLSGEALFTVAKDRQKPFRVLTNDSVIQAVGTQFNVYHRRADTTVTVVEGTVEIEALQNPDPSATLPTTEQSHSGEEFGVRASIIRVTKGQRAHIGAQDVPITVSAADAAVATAWRERRLTFESRPLGEVVAEFNLYNEFPIEIRDGALNAIQVSGSFNANDPQSFALFLGEAKLAKSQVESHKILLTTLATR